MKNRTLPLSVLVLLSLFIFSKVQAQEQCITLPEPFTVEPTGINMTLMLLPAFIQSLPVSTDSSYLVAITQSGLVVGGTSVASDNLLDGQTSLAVWGDDIFTTESDGAIEGELIILQLVDGLDLYDVIPVFSLPHNFVYTTNGVFAGTNSEVELNCTFNPEIGCMVDTACNYNPSANTQGECVYANDLCEICENGQIVDNDVDADGVCDADEIEGCQDETACNYNPEATDPPIIIPGATNNPMECVYTDGVCETCVDAVIVDNDTDGDAVCDANEIEGCLDETACNYNAATTDLVTCTYVDAICDSCVNGEIVDNDSDNDGVCDTDEIVGCQDISACNYNAAATDSTTCIYVDGFCETCSGVTDGTGTIIDNDADDDGVCDIDELEGCTDELACNYDARPTTDTENSLCIYSMDLDACATCSGEIDGTGVIVDNDSDDDGVCNDDEVVGCQDELACNFMELATDSASCNYTDGICESCVNGEIVDNDYDNDGVCNEFETEGCTNLIACNYNDAATDDDSSCEFAVTFYDCLGVCLNDFDGDGVCDPLEVLGCTDDAFMEYNLLATEDNGSCSILIVEGCTDATACNYNSAAINGDDSCLYVDDCGVCNGTNICAVFVEIELSLIIDESLVLDLAVFEDNFEDLIESQLGLPEGAVEVLEIIVGDGLRSGVDVQVIYTITLTQEELAGTDFDSEDTTNALNQISENSNTLASGEGNIFVDLEFVNGCQDSLACNYNERANIDLPCIYVTDCYVCSGENDGSGYLVYSDTDSDGVCDELEIDGCDDLAACNHDSTATEDDGSCTYAEDYYNCSGGCLSDSDGDGVCDELEVGVEEFVEIPMTLYPNPTQDFININFESNLSDVQLEVLNSIGDIVLSKTVVRTTANNSIQVDVSEMPDGLYLLKATLDGEPYILPWIKK